MPIRITLIITFILLMTSCASPPQPSAQQQQQFIQRASKENNLSPTQVKNALKQAHYSPSVIAKITKPYEAQPYDIYRQHFLTDKRIEEGAQFWKANRRVLDLAQKKYGVDPGVIIAILGVETLYGKNQGHYLALDALYTLAFFYPKRAPFFSHELAQYLVMCNQQHLSIYTTQGSYAGALGMPQFMPSSYRAYGVDFAGNHHIDLMNNTNDVIMSVANYLAAAGWQASQPIAYPVHPKYPSRNHPHTAQWLSMADFKKQGIDLQSLHLPTPYSANLLLLPDAKSNEYWLVFPNFKSILKYNTSPNYAMAVYQLSQAIRKKYVQHRS